MATSNKIGALLQGKMEGLILSRQLAASGTSLFQGLQRILWFLEWAPHPHNCLLCHLLIHWSTEQIMPEPLLCARHNAFYMFTEVLLSNYEVSWLLRSKNHGLCFFFSLQHLSWGWAHGRHLISTWLILGCPKWETIDGLPWYCARKSVCFRFILVLRNHSKGSRGLGQL